MDKILKELCYNDTIKYNLSLRARNKAASCFEHSNPENADGVPILARAKVTASDPNVKATYSNFSVIQRTKAGYMASNITRTYTDEIPQQVKDKYTAFDRLNHFQSKLKKMMNSCAGWGNTYSLCYLDTSKQARFKQVQAWNGKVVYDDNDEPQKGYVYYREKNQDLLYVYDAIEVTKYAKSKTATKYDLIEEATPHGFVGVPLIEWKNNDITRGNAQNAVSLMDAFDRLMSDNITEWATFRNAYLFLKNLGVIDEETAAKMQKTGAIIGDAENSEVRFVTKDVSPEFVKFITQETWSGIWIVASSVDPKALASLTNATAFQIAQLYRLMEEDCQDTEMEWKISLEYLDRILKSYWTGLDTKSVPDFSTEDVNYDFVRNIPKDVMTWLKDMVQAGGKLPQKEIFIKAGYDETKAEELAEAATEEGYASLPDLGIE